MTEDTVKDTAEDIAPRKGLPLCFELKKDREGEKVPMRPEADKPCSHARGVMSGRYLDELNICFFDPKMCSSRWKNTYDDDTITKLNFT
jgi:hypothetical protein